ncbi:beta-ureidopropionase, partial [bacterium]|nr:beta-ureidopropionase [bacterium]
FDWVYPETARLLAMEGAQIIAHPSNLVLQYCQQAMFARSVENRVFTITSNRIGTEDRAERVLTFTGASQVMNPRGERLIDAPTDSEHIGLAKVNPFDADDKKMTDYNHLFAGRRTDVYGPLVNPWTGPK